MGVSTARLEGSPNRDRFKRLHKDMGPGYNGCDLDFVCVDKYPPGIVCFIDYKTPSDSVTFAEVLCYNALKEVAPLYIVEGQDPNTGPFRIVQYMEGDWRPEPPIVKLEERYVAANWNELRKWEQGVRMAYRQRNQR